MPITDDQDLDRIDAIKRWHIFNRDPSDEHWQNIDALLVQYEHADNKQSEYIKELERDHERALSDLDRDYNQRTKSIKAEYNGMEDDLSKAEKQLAAERRRADYLENVATRQAELLHGAAGVDRLRSKLAEFAE